MEEDNKNGQDGGENAPVEPKEREKDQPIIEKDTAKKVIYSLCYLWGILFFLPLILYTHDAAARRHANEGLVLLLFSVLGNMVFGILTAIGGFMRPLFGAVAGAYSVLLLALGIIGIVYVVTDKDKPLPLLGDIRIIK